MKEDRLDRLFEELEGFFDLETPAAGHQERFLQKLQAQQKGITTQRPRQNWWRPLAIAASFALLCGLGLKLFWNPLPSMQEQVAQISPEASKSQFYFTNLVNEQVKKLEANSSPENKQLIDDTLEQLQKLEQDYKKMEQDLINGGNSKMILSAMITNFQTRIDLLNEVMAKVETIKNLKNYDDANITI